MTGRLCVVLLVLAICQRQSLSFYPGRAVLKSRTNFLVMYAPKIKLARRNAPLAAAFPAHAISLTTSKILNIVIPFQQSLSTVTIAWSAAFVLLTAIIARFKSKFTSKFALAVSEMEGGWTKRGYGGGFSRTWEVWSFAFSFIFKYVSNRTNLITSSLLSLLTSQNCFIEFLINIREKLRSWRTVTLWSIH